MWGYLGKYSATHNNNFIILTYNYNNNILDIMEQHGSAYCMAIFRLLSNIIRGY
jgi:hypothetical protein